MTTKIAIIIVEDSKGNLYMHKRSKEKKVFPNLYGMGAGGKVEAEETPTEAAQRELQEELGIKKEVEPLFDFPFTHPQATYHVYVHKTQHEGTINPCKKEFAHATWMSKEEVDKLDKEKQLCPDTSIAYKQYKEKIIGTL